MLARWAVVAEGQRLASAVGALRRIDFFVLLGQAKRTKKKENIIRFHPPA